MNAKSPGKKIVRPLLGRKPTVAFVHIPKTGGSYVVQEEKVLSSVVNLGHCYVVDKAGICNPLYEQHDPVRSVDYVVPLSSIRQYSTIVLTVRNIFDWLVSYAGHAGGWNPEHGPADSHYDFEAVNKGFDYLIKTIANREDLWPNRKFIHCQLFCSNGELIADWINRTETLDADLEALASHRGVEYTRRARKMSGKHKDYREYYTDSLVDLVYQTWQREIDLFGFDFEGSCSPTGLYRSIDQETKRGIRYYWAEDRLVVEGEKMNDC